MKSYYWGGGNWCGHAKCGRTNHDGEKMIDQNCTDQFNTCVEKITRTRGKKWKWKKSVEDMVPTRFHKYLSVFKKKESECYLCASRGITRLKPKSGFQLKKSKVYALSPKEQEEVDDFINEQLRKGIYMTIKSPQTSPIFFVPKKDHKKECAQITVI